MQNTQKDTNTKILHIKKTSENPYYAVNPPIVRASTIALKCTNGDLFPETNQQDYGIRGLEPHDSFAKAVSVLESAYNTIICNSGLEAISQAILSNAKSGENILMTDGVYVPTRKFCDGILKRLGITTTYYNPDDISNLDDLIQDNTTLLFAEFPATSTMHMGDIDGVLSFAKRHNLITVVDNCWGAGVLFRPLECGFDISIQAGTKYISGHSDVMLGTISVADKKRFNTMYTLINQMGPSVSPDAVYLGMRGLRTIHTRMQHHQKNTEIVMKWLENHPLVDQLLTPVKPDCIGHKHWKKHFSGYNGLFSFVFKDTITLAQIDTFVNSLELFVPGWGWGGYESIISVIVNPPRTIDALKWQKSPIIRIHIGLESPKDLIADLNRCINNLTPTKIFN